MRIHKMKVMGRDLGFDKNKMKERDFEWGFVVANMHIMCVCVCVCYRFQMTKKQNENYTQKEIEGKKLSVLQKYK